MEVVEIFDCVGTGVSLFPRDGEGAIDPFIRAGIKNLMGLVDKAAAGVSPFYRA